MPTFVILSLALAAITVAVLVLVAIQLLRTLRTLRGAAAGVRDRLEPLTAELRDELAVTATETHALRRSLDDLRDARAARRHHKQGLREALRESVSRPDGTYTRTDGRAGGAAPHDRGVAS